MSGSRAKVIREQVYGTDLSPRIRQYQTDTRGTRKDRGFRRLYQEAKAAYYQKKRGVGIPGKRGVA